MKRLMVVLAALMMVLAAAVMAQTPVAEEPQDQPGPDMNMAWEPGGADPGPMDMGPDMGLGGGMGPGAFMGCGMRGPRGFGMERIMAMADTLGLTDAQRDKFKQLQDAFMLSRIDQDAALKKAELKLRSLMMNDKAAEAEVSKAIDDVSRLRADMAKARYHHMNEMRSVLTDKQQEMLKDLKMDCRRAPLGCGAGKPMQGGKCGMGAGRGGRR